MKKWKKGLIVAGVVTCSAFSLYKNAWHQPITPSSLTKYIRSSEKLTNFHDEAFLSISFKKSGVGYGELRSLVDKIDNSTLDISDSRVDNNEDLNYDLMSQGQDFTGERDYQSGQLVLKSPMYRKFITFPDPESAGLHPGVLSFTPLYQAFESYVQNSRIVSINTDSGSGSNVGRMVTVDISGTNKSAKQFLLGVSNITTSQSFVSFEKENLLVENKLLKQHRVSGEIGKDATERVEAINHSLESVLENSKVRNSSLALSINTKDRSMEYEAKFDLEYVLKSGQRVEFTLYMSAELSDIGVTPIKSLGVTSSNSIAYVDMNDSVDYSAYVNGKYNSYPDLDKQNTRKGADEFASTLSALGDFTPVIPKSTSSSKQ